jgi:hypothetical protein
MPQNSTVIALGLPSVAPPPRLQWGNVAELGWRGGPGLCIFRHACKDHLPAHQEWPKARITQLPTSIRPPSFHPSFGLYTAELMPLVG